jgi:type VI secretion system protein ImpL
MRAIVSFLKNPLVTALLGLLAIALVIWFVGPLIAIAGYEPLVGVPARLVLILLVVVIWGAHQLRKRLGERRANAQMAEGLAQGEAAAAATPAARAAQGEDDVARLRQRFTEALAVLKKSRGGRGGAPLYSLPWYVIIGPPGAGKTTALQNSGLRFPLADRFGNEALRGVGGTRNCDWWFTDEAILVDTAGRYFTQDSDPNADSGEWKGFLALLKKHRRRRPLNGVLLAISLSDLLLQTPADRANHVQAVKQRIGELYEYFGIRFPIYVLLTKADLIAGFTEFFDDLGKERAQVWGFTLPIDAADTAPDLAAQVRTEFDALLGRLNDRLLARMEQERDPARRAMIFGFPRQVALLREPLGEFLTGCFRPSQYETPQLLRGMYLTSGTQEGTPIDRLLGAVARGFGLASQVVAPRGPGRSYFLTDLLRRVVFAEADLAGTNRRLERLRAWGQRGAYAGAAAVVLLAGLAWLVSYRSNRGYVDEVARQADGIQKEAAALSAQNLDPAATLPVLNAARAIPGGYADRERGAPWSARFGLYQGRKLGTAAQETYQRLLRNALLPRLVLRVEDQLRNGPNDPDFQLEALRVYRMLGEGTHFEPESVQAWMALDWEAKRDGRLTADDQQRLEAHLKALLETPPAPAAVPLDGALIRQTQRTLRAAPLAERAYARLKRHPAEGVRPFTIAEAAGKDAPLVFARRSGAALTDGIPGLYTRAGYENVFLGRSRDLSQRLAEEDWVLRDDAGGKEDAGGAGSAELEAGVLKLYLDDYGRQYENLLADLTLVPIRNMDQAVYVLQILSADDSPMLALLQGVARETTLAPDAPGKDKAEEAKAGAIDAAKSRLRELLGSTASNAAAQATGGRDATVREFAKTRFGELQQQVVAKEGAKPPFQAVLATLNELYVFMDSVRKNPNAAKALMEGSRQLDAIVGNLQRQAERQPKVVQGVLGEVAATSKSLSSGDVREHLNAVWRTEGLAFCRQAIADRYPLVRDSHTDVTLQDFGNFFGPGGVMDAFFEKNLGDLVDTSRSPWQWRPGGGMASASPGALVQFDRARRIKETFFADGGKLPAVSFELTPVTMDPSITQFVIDIEGTRVTYDHGPAVPAVVAWPGKGPRQVRIEMAPPAGSGPSGTTESGPWGWFRLLDRSRLEASGTREQFDVTFSVGGRNARFRLAATSAFNPFGSDLLRAFRCPETL